MSVVESLMNILGCGERTAASIEKIIHEAGISDVSCVSNVPDDVYRVIEVKGSSSDLYYIFIGRGYFVEEIRKDNIDGDSIYYAVR